MKRLHSTYFLLRSCLSSRSFRRMELPTRPASCLMQQRKGRESRSLRYLSSLQRIQQSHLTRQKSKAAEEENRVGCVCADSSTALHKHSLKIRSCFDVQNLKATTVTMKHKEEMNSSSLNDFAQRGELVGGSAGLLISHLLNLFHKEERMFYAYF